MFSKNTFPFYIFSILTSTLLLKYGGSLGILPAFLSVIIGLLTWNFLEYGFHRFIFHNLRLSKKIRKAIAHAHNIHHRKPKELRDVILPLKLSITISTLFFIIFTVLAGTGCAAYGYLGLITGYFFYEFMHYQAHHRNSKLWFFRKMKAYHLAHHDRTTQGNFMVTMPFMDYLFGTK